MTFDPSIHTFSWIHLFTFFFFLNFSIQSHIKNRKRVLFAFFIFLEKQTLCSLLGQLQGLLSSELFVSCLIFNIFFVVVDLI